MLEFALLAFTVLVVTVGHWTLSLLVGLLIGCLLIGLALFFAVRSLRQPYIYVNANSRTIEHGTQKIPFSRISNIRATPRTQSFGRIVYDVVNVGSSDLNKTCIDIQVVLNNGEVIELGSVSGNVANSVLSRATAITQLVAEVTSAAIREPVEAVPQTTGDPRKAKQAFQYKENTSEQGSAAKKIAIGSVIGLLLGSLLLLGVSRAVMGPGPGYRFDLMLEIKNLLLEVMFISPGAVVGGIIAYYRLGRFLDKRGQILDERRQILTVAVGSVIGVIASIACFFYIFLQV